ncbi:hypothetical protein [Pseudomonas defluvii]|uniref:hypothetical protein n=1 Tax=Pseudomonas defluvii TaxID=1876757 RepID=UPI000811A10B|nr:hypothetical protein [Pseudomonas defluvii]
MAAIIRLFGRKSCAFEQWPLAGPATSGQAAEQQPALLLRSLTPHPAFWQAQVFKIQRTVQVSLTPSGYD